MMNRRYVTYGLVLLLLALGLRLTAIYHVGIEVDEPVNWEVSQFISENGYPGIKGQLGGDPEVALFHPAFGFQLVAEWFTITGNHNLVAARMVSVFSSVLAIVMITVLVWKTISPQAGLVVLLLLSTDGWLVTTNSMYYLENLLLPLVVGTVWAYYWCVRDGFRWYHCVGLGILLGSVFVFKHIGFYMVLVIISGWIAIRKYHKMHILVFAVSGFVVMGYGLYMYHVWGDVWWEQTLHQLQRTIGLQASRGLNYNILTAVKVIVDRYWVYAMTILALVTGASLAMLKYAASLKLYRRYINTKPTLFVVVCWSIGAILFASGTALKSPHYFMLWLFPFLSLIAIALETLKQKWPTITKYVLVLIVIVNTMTFAVRILVPHGDAIAEAAAYVSETLSAESLIATEPYIGFLIPQPYVRYDQSTKESLLRDGVDYLVVYQTTTAHIPEEIGGETVWEYCSPLTEVSGFKDSATICKVNPEKLRLAVETSK